MIRECYTEKLQSIVCLCDSECNDKKVIVWLTLLWADLSPLLCQICAPGCTPLWGISRIPNVEVSLPVPATASNSSGNPWQNLWQHDLWLGKLCDFSWLFQSFGLQIHPWVSYIMYLVCLEAALLALHSICRVYINTIMLDWQLHGSFGPSRNSTACIDQTGLAQIGHIYSRPSESSMQWSLWSPESVLSGWKAPRLTLKSTYVVASYSWPQQEWMQDIVMVRLLLLRQPFNTQGC